MYSDAAALSCAGRARWRPAESPRRSGFAPVGRYSGPMRSAGSTKKPRSSSPQALEPLRWWHLLLGLPAMALYMLGNALAGLGLVSSPWPGRVVYAIAVVILASVIRTSWSSFRAQGWRAAAGVLLAFALAFALNALVWPAIVQVLGLPGANTNQEMVRALVLRAPVLMGLMVVVAGPVVEEVLYRFVLLRPLLKVNSPLAHAVAALAFGFQHVAVAVLVNHDTAQLWNIVPYAAFGLIQSVLYVRQRSLIGPILVHVLVNGLGLAAVLAGSTA